MATRGRFDHAAGVAAALRLLIEQPHLHRPAVDQGADLPALERRDPGQPLDLAQLLRDRAAVPSMPR